MSYYGASIQGEPDNQAHTVIAWVVTVLTLFYMLPWAIAATRHTKNAPVIGVLTFLFGWSGVGWLGALVWACVDAHKNAHLQTPVVVAPVLMAPVAMQPAYPQQAYPQQQPSALPARSGYTDPYAIDPYADIQDPVPSRPDSFPQYQPSAQNMGAYAAPRPTTYVQQLPSDDPRALPPGQH